MFWKTRVLWTVNKSLSDVLYDSGERDNTLAGTIIAKEVLGDGELSFAQEANIFRKRSRKNAAYMVLVETASAWQLAGNERYADYCLQAAGRLLHIFVAEPEPEKVMMEQFDKRVAERQREMAWRDA